MKRLFTLLLVFFFGIVVGAAFFSEDAPNRSEDQTASEVLAQTLFNVLGTTRETARALADEIRPHLNQLSYLTNEQFREYYNTLSLKYHLPVLTDGQLEGLVSALRSIGSLAGPSSENPQSGIESLTKASTWIDAGVKMLSALQRILRMAGGYIQEVTGRAG